MKRKLLCVLLVGLLVLPLSACGSKNKGLLPSERADELFTNPKDLIGFTVEMSGQVVSSPTKTREYTELSVMIDTGYDGDILYVYTTPDVDVQIFDIVSFTGTIGSTMSVTNEKGTVDVAKINDAVVTVTDTSQRQENFQGGEDIPITPGMTEAEIQAELERQIIEGFEAQLNGQDVQ